MQVSQEDVLLRNTLRDLFAARLPMNRVMERADVERPADTALWNELSSLGIPSLLLPVEAGGADLGFSGLRTAAEEFGAALAPDDAIAAAVAWLLLTECDSVAFDDLRKRASSRSAISVLGDGVTADWEGDTAVATGICPLVPSPSSEAVLLVKATVDGGAALLLLEPNQDGINLTPVHTIDPTRQRVDMVLAGARTKRVARAGPATAKALRLAWLAAGLATAADSIGAARQALHLAVDYAKEREQFGARIGSFQAVKHVLVDTYVAVENARAQSLAAASALNSGDALADVSVAAAKVLADQASVQAGANAIQVLGGIGFTKEMPAHLFLRRAKLNEVSAGSTRWHLDYLGLRLDDAMMIGERL